MDEQTTTTVIDIGDKLEGLLTSLASKLDLTAKDIWPWMMKQVILDAISGMIVTGAALVLSLLAFNYFRKFPFWGTYDPTPKGMCAAISVLSSLVLIFIILFLIPDWIGAILNPEYAALLRLTSMIK